VNFSVKLNLQSVINSALVGEWSVLDFRMHGATINSYLLLRRNYSFDSHQNFLTFFTKAFLCFKIFQNWDVSFVSRASVAAHMLRLISIQIYFNQTAFQFLWLNKHDVIKVFYSPTDALVNCLKKTILKFT
jgi:hypothetical protein